jgi:hypothetical protein
MIYPPPPGTCPLSNLTFTRLITDSRGFFDAQSLTRVLLALTESRPVPA